MEVCAATFSGSLYPSEWRVTMPLKAHVDLPESVHPMCWCTWGVEVAVWASCCEVSSRVGAVLGRASHAPGTMYGDMVQRPPVLRTNWTYPDAAGPTGQALMHGPRLSSSCRREAMDLDIWDPFGWLVWCSEIPFGSLPWFATGVSNSTLGPERIRTNDQIYLFSTEKNAMGGRKSEASLTSSLRATTNVNKSSANENVKND